MSEPTPPRDEGTARRAGVTALLVLAPLVVGVASRGVLWSGAFTPGWSFVAALLGGAGAALVALAAWAGSWTLRRLAWCLLSAAGVLVAAWVLGARAEHGQVALLVAGSASLWGALRARDDDAPPTGGGVKAVALCIAAGVALLAVRRAPAPTLGSVHVVEKTRPCPEGMVYIAGGTFTMGSPDGVGQGDEQPEHPVTLPAFCIDRTEVSVQAYQECVGAGGCAAAPTTFEWPTATEEVRRVWSQFCNGNHLDRVNEPINCIDWSQARRFCDWRNARLPREAEWEFAARGEGGRRYPWGNEEPDGDHANLCGEECASFLRDRGASNPFRIEGWRDAYGGLAPVDSFARGATPEGVLNLAGNVWEWIEDVYASDAYLHHDARGFYARDASVTSLGTELRVLRGGGWNYGSAAVARSAYRSGSEPTDRNVDVGVRCARGALEQSVNP